ncbi:hypothetical protein [Legionella gresilensis]|uniref:hypothetical protein n=1 Tax=Legionella gresilensis TaxID=91823 RepID=UPI00104113E8|nr:hypothetical protein [Legionella gresilensis]
MPSQLLEEFNRLYIDSQSSGRSRSGTMYNNATIEDDNLHTFTVTNYDELVEELSEKVKQEKS